MCFVCKAVGKADTAASLLAQQSADISAEKVTAQPTQLAASYGIGTIDLYTRRSSFGRELVVILTNSANNPVAVYFYMHCMSSNVGQSLAVV